MCIVLRWVESSKNTRVTLAEGELKNLDSCSSLNRCASLMISISLSLSDSLLTVCARVCVSLVLVTVNCIISGNAAYVTLSVA